MIAKRTSLTGNAMMDYTSTTNLLRRCADVFYRRRPSQASLPANGFSRRRTGTEDGARLQPQEAGRDLPQGVSSVHGRSRSWAVLLCDGESSQGTGRRGENGECASGQSDRPCPDQDGQAGFENTGPALAGGPDSGDLSTGGQEPAGATSDEGPGLLGSHPDGNQEQDSGALGSAERRDPDRGGQAQGRAVQRKRG